MLVAEEDGWVAGCFYVHRARQGRRLRSDVGLTLRLRHHRLSIEPCRGQSPVGTRYADYQLRFCQ